MLSPAHRRECLLACRLELITGLPGRQRVRLSDQPRREHGKLCVLDHPIEVPAAIEPIGGLMVLVELPLLFLLTAPAGGAPDEVRAVIEKQRRHADVGERELVGAIVVAAVGKLIALDYATLRCRNARGGLIERGLAECDRRRIVRAPENVAAIDVDVRGDPAGRKGGMLRVVLRAEKSALLAGDE